jgi:hypothetical protein
MITRRCLRLEREQQPLHSCATAYLVTHASDEDSVAMRWAGGGLRGRLPDLSGARRRGKGPPLACSIAVRVSSSESTMICASVWCPVQYTALRSRSTKDVGRATVTRCLEARARGGDGCRFSVFLAPLVEEIMSGMRVVYARIPVSGCNRPPWQRWSVIPAGIRPARQRPCLVACPAPVGLHQ